ncbi:TetR/AcrR family transcriptional regulator [Weissella paramesenteroides]|uniref:TetR/AcrR family transcriptional regulator n=1 Tax=Weissella paramesenteroides TaxID=1249 RepID=UPI003F746979
MVRPKKSENENPVRSRIGQEFWKLLRNKPLAQITVSELVKKAECNRATFYYYFDNVDDLAWKMLKESIPVELTKIAQAYFTGEIENVTIDPETMHVIERLSVLIGKDGSSELANLAADALKKVWSKEFLTEGNKNDEELSYMFDFMASGIIGIISRYGRSSDTVRLKESLLLINTLFSKTSLDFIASKK